MKPQGLLIATVLLLALGGAVYWSNRDVKRKEAAPPKDAPPKILAVQEGDIKEIILRRRDSDPTVVAKDASGKWSLTTPKPLAVDIDALTGVTNALVSLNAEQVIEEKAADIAAYGLNAPSLTLDLTTKEGKTHKLQFGDDTPTGGNVYVTLDGIPKIYTLSTSTKSSFDKTWQDLRDRRLLTFDDTKLTRVSLTAKKSTVEFGKNNQNEWAILAPKPLRADGWQVEELVRKLKEAKMDVAISDDDAKKWSAAFTSGTSIATAKLTDSAGTQTLDVRKSKDDYYARSTAVEGTYKIPADLGTAVDKSLDDFRNKKLFDFAFSEPTRIEVKNGPAAPVSYAKTGDKWFSGPKQIDSTSLQNFVDKLRDLSSTKFLDSGFTAPLFEVTVTSNEGKRKEKVLVAKTASGYLAIRENELAVYQLDPKAAEDLIKTSSDIKPAEAAKK